MKIVSYLKNLWAIAIIADEELYRLVLAKQVEILVPRIALPRAQSRPVTKRREGAVGYLYDAGELEKPDD